MGLIGGMCMLGAGAGCSAQADPDYRGEPVELVRGIVQIGDGEVPASAAAGLVWRRTVATTETHRACQSMPTRGRAETVVEQVRRAERMVLDKRGARSEWSWSKRGAERMVLEQAWSRANRLGASVARSETVVEQVRAERTVLEQVRRGANGLGTSAARGANGLGASARGANGLGASAARSERSWS
jgi:hypothetical protein